MGKLWCSGNSRPPQSGSSAYDVGQGLGRVLRRPSAGWKGAVVGGNEDECAVDPRRKECTAAVRRDYELHSLDFSIAFLQGNLHKHIWLRRPPGFIGSFPAGTQWSLRRLVYGLLEAPREWHDTQRTTLAALGFAPSTADPSPFYVLVYVDDLVFATADTEALTLITRDRAQLTITLTQSHMVHQELSHAALPSRAAQPSRAAFAELRRAAEPRRTAEPRCPSACLATAAIAATATTAATAAMASPTVLTFDAEGRAVDFDV
ncbi:unnamed protein product [Closterium sp. NIES-53]